MNFADLFPLKVGSRASPLAIVQVDEVLKLLKKFNPTACFTPTFQQTYGDKDLNTSLRTLGHTDFFTKEIDELVLQGVCRIGIHSAKDLPIPLTKGLELVALTRGVDPSDSLVLREFDTLESLPLKALIATSSKRREEMAKQLRSDFTFTDLRGTIGHRLSLLEKGEADGVIIAEAALIRLKLTHLNRIRLPGPAAAFQGQLAIIAREEDQEMKELFLPLDSRSYKKAVYLGEELPSHAFLDRMLIHYPLIETKLRSSTDANCQFLIQNWEKFTHLIFTSKNGVKHLASLLRKHQISPFEIGKKTVIALGKATAEVLIPFGKNPFIADFECAEGVIPLIEKVGDQNSYFLWPHSSLARPLISDYFKQKKFSSFSCPLYDTFPLKNTDIPFPDSVDEVVFSSPSTVKAFFERRDLFSKKRIWTPIGPITEAILAKYKAIEQNPLQKE